MSFVIAVITLILFALITLVVWIYRQLHYWQWRGVKHRKPHPLYGNLQGVMETKHFADIFREIYNQFKGTRQPFVGFYMLFKPCALILDLDLVKKVLIKDFADFSERGFFFNERDDPLTAHLFALPTHMWQPMKRKLTPAFSTGRLRTMYPLVQEIATRLIKTIGDRRGEVMEMKDLFDRYTTDVIGCCVFGLECNSLKDPHPEFRSMNQNLFDNPRNHRAVDGLLYAFPKVARWLRLKQIPDVTSEFYFRIVRDTIAYRRQHPEEQRRDLMSVLMQLQDEGSLSLNEIVANAFLFFFAGFETSSTTLTMAMYELARHPEHQERCRQEVLKALETTNGEFSYECLLNIAYLDQVLNETLRLHTIIPNLQRITMNSYEVDGHPEFHIAKGTLLFIPVEAIHHDPEIYENPGEFQPDRFDAAEIKKRHPMAWLPFGDGPRNCIGMQMGKMQMRLALAQLLKEYRFTVCAETPRQLSYYMQCPFLVPKCGIYLKVERIKEINE